MVFVCPPKDCAQCPRLVEFRKGNMAKFPTYYNGPVPPFGPIEAEVLIVGLAPGLNGANQTARQRLCRRRAVSDFEKIRFCHRKLRQKKRRRFRTAKREGYQFGSLCAAAEQGDRRRGAYLRKVSD